MTSDIKWSCTAHTGIALLVGIAAIARARIADLPSTTFSAAFGGAAIFMVAAVMVNRAESATSDRFWLLFSFYIRSIAALTAAAVVAKTASPDRSWWVLSGLIILWCCTSLARTSTQNAAATFALSPAETQSIARFTNAVALLQFWLFLPTFLFL